MSLLKWLNEELPKVEVIEIEGAAEPADFDKVLGTIEDEEVKKCTLCLLV